MSGVWIRGIAGLALTALATGTAPMGAAQQCSGMTNLWRVQGVSANPFQAEMNATIPNSTQERKPVIVARDSQGRVRNDIVVGTYSVKEPSGREAEIERHYTVICDPVGMKMITLDTLNKTATVQRLSSSSLQRSSPFCDVELHLGLNQPNVKVEDLGHRPIEGLDAHGVMELQTDPNAANPAVRQATSSETQLWCSAELGAMVLKVMDTPGIKGAFRFAMTNIQRAEPPVALFSIPADYKVLELLDLSPQPR